MKLWLSVLTVLFVAGAIAARADSYATSVGTNSVLIVPEAGLTGMFPVWTSGVVRAIGGYASVSERNYAVVTQGGGASTSSPAISGDTPLADGYLWRRALSRSRKGIIFVNSDPSNSVYVADGTAAVGRGMWLRAGGGANTLTGLDCPPCAWYAISAGTGTVTWLGTIEW